MWLHSDTWDLGGPVFFDSIASRAVICGLGSSPLVEIAPGGFPVFRSLDVEFDGEMKLVNKDFKDSYCLCHLPLL